MGLIGGLARRGRRTPTPVILSEAKDPFPPSYFVTSRDGRCGFFGLRPQNDGKEQRGPGRVWEAAPREEKEEGIGESE